MEELVAELGAAFLSADLELTPEAPRGSRRLYRVVDQGSKERQARHLYRRVHAQRAADFLHEPKVAKAEAEAA